VHGTKADSMRTEAARARRARQKTECLAFQYGPLIGRLAPTQHSATAGKGKGFEGGNSVLWVRRGGGPCQSRKLTSICHSRACHPSAILPTHHLTAPTLSPTFPPHKCHYFHVTHHGPTVHKTASLFEPVRLPACPLARTTQLHCIFRRPLSRLANNQPELSPSAVRRQTCMHRARFTLFCCCPSTNEPGSSDRPTQPQQAVVEW
jgi:hypothetical protein